MTAMFTTPGPWHADGWLIEDESHNPRTVATTAARGERGKADAKLIAAAPDLYAALRHLIEDDVYLSDKHLAPVRAALAKAEGRAAERSDAPSIPKFGTPGCAGGSEES